MPPDPPSEDLVLAVCLALAGAASFGLGSAAQQGAAAGVSSPLRLIREPRWVAGLGGVGAGLTLQILALAFGPVALVQPLGVTGIVFGALSGAWLTGRAPHAMVVLGATACAGGLAAFLVLARPGGPQAGLGTRGVAPIVVLSLLVVAALVAARRWGGALRVVALAGAAGICYGVTAGLLKLVADQIRAGGITEPFHHWTLLVVCLTGPPGFLLSQHAFAQSRSVALPLAVLTVVDPLVAVAVGVSWLGEHLTVTPTALAGEVLAVAAVGIGVVLLARHGEAATSVTAATAR